MRESILFLHLDYGYLCSFCGGHVRCCAYITSSPKGGGVLLTKYDNWCYILRGRLKTSQDHKTRPRVHLIGSQGVKLFLLKDLFKFSNCVLWEFEFFYIVKILVLDLFCFQIWVFNFCHNVSFTFKVLFQFKFLSFLTISFLEFGAIWVLSFVVIWVFPHNMVWDLSQEEFLSFDADLKFCQNFHNWDIWFLSQLEVLSFITIFFLLLSQ